MRWPWQRKDLVPAPVTPPEASSVEPPVTPSRPPADPAPSPAGWAFLPPLQRTVGDLGTTTALHRFPDQLPTRANPSFTRTMSHLISAEAPAGVIDLDGPDAGPTPDAPGSEGRSVEMPLLPPPAPRSTRPNRPVQRLTSSAPAAEPSLTTVPDGNYGVLRLPVVPEPAPEPTGPPAEPEDAGAANADVGPASGDPSTDTPATGLPPADPSLEGTTLGASAHSTPGVGSATPSTAPTDGSRSGGAGPGPVPTRAPLQRKVPEPPGGSAGSTSGTADGSSSDGTATSVPLPARPALQRSSGPGSNDSAPVPAPALPSFPSPRSSGRRLGLGSPWPDPVGLRATAVEENASPRVQRVAGFPELPSAGATTPPVNGIPSSPQPPADRNGTMSSVGRGSEPARHGTDATAQSAAEPVPAPVPTAETSAGHGGPEPTSPFDGSPPPAVAVTEPVVSRSVADGASGGVRPDAASPTATPVARPIMPADAAGAPFADPPLFAGRQSPDPHSAEPLPVVSRNARGATAGATGQGAAAEGPRRTDQQEPGGALGSAPADTSLPKAAATPLPTPLSVPPVAAAPPHDTAQRAGEGAPGTSGESALDTARTVEPAGAVEDATQDIGQPAGTEGPPPTATDAPAGSAPDALVFSTPPDLPPIDPADGPQELSTAPALSPGDHVPGPSRPTDLPVVTRSAASPATDAAPSGPDARVDARTGPDPGAGPGIDPDVSGADVPDADAGSEASGPDLPRAEPLTVAHRAASGPTSAEPVVSRVITPGTATSATMPPGFLATASTSGKPAGADGPGPVDDTGVPAGAAPSSSAATPLQRTQAPPAPRATRPLGLRPPRSLSVVSRSVDDGPGPPTSGRPLATHGSSGHPKAPVTSAFPAPPSGTAPPSWATPAAAPLTPVSRSVGTDLLLPHGPVEASTPGTGSDRPVPGGENGADPALSGDVPVLSVTASSAAVPDGGTGWASSVSGALFAPAGPLQRPAAGPAVQARRTGAQPPVLHGGVVGGSTAPGVEPEAMRLAAPPPQPPGPAGDISARAESSGVPVTAQRAAADVAPVPEPPVAETPPESARSVTAPPAATDQGMSQEQVDELADRLVGPIVRRIKADMLLDRERRGLRIDRV